MKKIVTVFAVGLLLVAGAATAGFKSAQQVVIGSTFANGDLGYVHNTADLTQYIGCETYAYPNQLSAYCYARDLNGNYKSCFTSNANMVNVASSLKSDGYLIFYVDTSGNCTFIEQRTDSETQPK